MGARASANDIVPTVFGHAAPTGCMAVDEVTRTVPMNRGGSVDTAVRDTGTIVLERMEGGCWLIDTSTERYYPINLSANVQVDGLHVQFEGVLRADVATFCPGLVIELSRISELGG